MVYIKTDYIYKDIAQNVETKFDTSNYKLDRQLHCLKVKIKSNWINHATIIRTGIGTGSC